MASVAESTQVPPTMEDRRAVLYRMTQVGSGAPAQLEAYERELSFSDALGLDLVNAEHLRGILFAAQQVEVQREALNAARAALWLRALKASGLSDHARIPFPFDDQLPWAVLDDSEGEVRNVSTYVPPSAEFVARARFAADLESHVASGSGSVPPVSEVGGLTLGGDVAA